MRRVTIGIRMGGSMAVSMVRTMNVSMTVATGHHLAGRGVGMSSVRMPVHSARFPRDQVPPPMPQCHQQGIATQDCPAENEGLREAQHQTAIRNATPCILLRAFDQSQQ